ncbi:Uncharacterised protein [Mycobacteroides abscessus subsp. abscessus]|nr:Uncharacterised protein [Mycobacteroides abscessus subsp. abscessus]SKF88301.1 Uncharacterised protein [Mycobacteroides abscessus subsp. bolletii]SIL85922.1 Uncharacterised protein [Mycobacteroides abscessus subsp. abscessus]SIM03482.1 Uncharacterised protein [Mycobacteroides abscessus subsp. abscessus]SKG33881.1 Uncharacterised protein [Mycobacteroides abscessus subsp. bolletii]
MMSDSSDRERFSAKRRREAATHIDVTKIAGQLYFSETGSWSEPRSLLTEEQARDTDRRS